VGFLLYPDPIYINFVACPVTGISEKEIAA
jgi:hypothetical protein